MATFKQDYLNGTKSEDEIFNTIKDYFNDNIIKSSSKTSRYDFKGDKNYYELKTRTNKYSDYPTTLIPDDKLIYENLVLLFRFTDGLYYINYDEELFKTFEKKTFKRRLRADYTDKAKPYIYIPINKLSKINI